MQLLPILELGSKLIDKLIPDPEARARAQIELIKLEQQGQLEDMRTRLSAIIAEAQSQDPWTSRARPSFLYVVYLLILWALPMGIIAAVSPETSQQIADGAKAWLAAIPDSLIELFMFVMLGYIGGRSYEKVKGATK